MKGPTINAAAINTTAVRNMPTLGGRKQLKPSNLVLETVENNSVHFLNRRAILIRIKAQIYGPSSILILPFRSFLTILAATSCAAGT